MKSTLRAQLGALAVVAGLVGVTACGSSSPAALNLTVISGTTRASSTPTLTPTAPVGAIPAPSGGSVAPGSGSGTPVANGPTSSAQREINPAGDIPDNQAFVPYVSSTSKFSVTVPEGWARTDTAAGVLFTDKYNSIRVETRPATSAPTAASIRSSDLPALAASAAGFTVGDVTTVSRKAGTAILLTYRADTPPNAVTGKVTAAAFERYVFFRAGTEVVITVGAPVGGDNVDPWRKVTDSFGWSA